MRLWNFMMIPYLPDNQLRGQWRECVLIAKDICEKGKTNHLLINRIMNYNIKHFNLYCQIVWECMDERKIYTTLQSEQKMFKYLGIKFDLDQGVLRENLFEDWHNKEYLRVCMANLYEKHVFGVGKSRITDEEWETLLKGYKELTGEDYVI